MRKIPPSRTVSREPVVPGWAAMSRRAPLIARTDSNALGRGALLRRWSRLGKPRTASGLLTRRAEHALASPERSRDEMMDACEAQVDARIRRVAVPRLGDAAEPEDRGGSRPRGPGLGHSRYEENLSVAGRTDTGVHALGQVASVDVEGGPPIEHSAKALNTALPTTSQ